MKPIRTDFTGYEGKYVAIDARTGEVVIAAEDLCVVFGKPRAVITRDRRPRSIRGRADHVGLG